MSQGNKTEHQHAFKSQGPAAIMLDGTRVRVKRCRCGKFKTNSRKLSRAAQEGGRS